MPCWYYEKRDLRYTPSYRDGIDPETEARYRREGARFIIDTGTKMGLRYDTCATGVVYFHRFYMFHSFREFHRYVTGSCCLFLAGKVEETPKKCKDIIKNARGMLTETQFAVFGEDPKVGDAKAMEEVMTLERILLQTIKFDLQVSHPYAYLLRYAKFIKGDKNKVGKLIQMAWTFINDSLCTTLCLQWEPDIISVALMYLASRLSKFDVTDYEGKTPGSKKKWWEFLVEDATMDLLEDICHQVLDLYSAPQSKREDSPPLSARPLNQPMPPAPVPQQMAVAPPNIPQVPQKRPKPVLPQEKLPGNDKGKGDSKKKSGKGSSGAKMVKHGSAPQPVMPPSQPRPEGSMGYSSSFQQYQGSGPETYTQQNPFISANMTANSFLSSEGAQSIQTLIGGGTSAQQIPKQAPVPYSTAPYQQTTTTDVYSQAPYNQQLYPQPGYQGYAQQQPAPVQPPQPPAQQPQVPAQQQNYNYQQTAQYAQAQQQQHPQFPAGAQQFPASSQPQPPPPQPQPQPQAAQQFPGQPQFQAANQQQFPPGAQPNFPPTTQQQFNYPNQNFPAQNVQNQYAGAVNPAYPPQQQGQVQQQYQGPPQFPGLPQAPQQPPPQFPPVPQPTEGGQLPQFTQQQPFQPANFPPQQFATSVQSSRAPVPPVKPLMSANISQPASTTSTGLATVRITGRQIF